MSDTTFEAFDFQSGEFTADGEGVVRRILDFHRAQFGGARMEADDSDSGGDDGGDGGRQGRDGQDGREERRGSDRDRGQRDRDRGREDDSDSGDDEGLSAGGKRALEAERRSRREAEKARREAEKDAKALAEKVAEFERAQMSEQERTAAERDDWRKKYEDLNAALAERDLEILRRDVAAEKGLPAGMARRLNGTTREELESDADELVTMVAVPESSPQPRTPKPDPSQGVTSSGTRASTVAAVMEKYMAGRGTSTT